MSLKAWPLALADEACLAPLMERPDGGEPGPCRTCEAWASGLLVRAWSGGRQGWLPWAAHEARAPVAGVPA